MEAHPISRAIKKGDVTEKLNKLLDEAIELFEAIDNDIKDKKEDLREAKAGRRTLKNKLKNILGGNYGTKRN